MIVLESAFSQPAKPEQAIEFETARDEVLILPARPQLAQLQLDEAPAQRRPPEERPPRDSPAEFAADEQPAPQPAEMAKPPADTHLLANARADAQLQLVRTSASRRPTVELTAAKVASRSSPQREVGVRSGPSFAGNAPPRYPDLARKNRWEGQVLLRLSISADGRVSEVEVIRSSGYEILDEAAVSAVRTWRGRPALLDGEPVAAEESLPIRFRVR